MSKKGKGGTRKKSATEPGTKGEGSEIRKSAPKDQDDYQVGYKKPPLHTRFSSTNQPLVNGGLVRRGKNLKTALSDRLDQIAEQLGVESDVDVIALRLCEFLTEQTINGQAVTNGQLLAAISLISERMFGKPSQSVQIEDNRILADTAWIDSTIEEAEIEDAKVDTEPESE